MPLPLPSPPSRLLQSALRGLIGGLLAVACPAGAQTNFSIIASTGPASNRVNIVFLAEGYRTNQYATFLTDATNAANILLTNQPYAGYRSFFNVYAIAVPSLQSGSDHPIASTSATTYFNSTFGWSDYYLSIPPNAFDANPNNGQGRVTALLSQYVPSCDLAILLVNDPTPGGSDGGGSTALVSRGAVYSQFFSILAHEAGHVLVGLGDEYSAANPGYPDIEEPNTTRETNRSAVKWQAWIAPDTPVPTPPAGYEDAVGLFEGAHYHTTGWYRPRVNCQMGAFGYGLAFCEVCQEAGVLAYYRQVRPIEAYAPASTNLTVTNSSGLNFNLTTVTPLDHALAFQWLTNGVAIPSGTNAGLTLAPTTLAAGTNLLTVRVTDPTLLVRTDPTNLLTQTLTWRLAVNLPSLTLSAPRALAGGRFAFRISGVAPLGFSIHGSTNLTSWTPLATNSLVSGIFDFTNQSGTNLPRRFFRAVTPPQP